MHDRLQQGCLPISLDDEQQRQSKSSAPAEHEFDLGRMLYSYFDRIGRESRGDAFSHGYIK